MSQRYISVEAPDTEAKVDFLGKHGFTVTVKTEKNKAGKPEVYVCVTADDDRCSILGEIVAVIPKSDTRR